MSHLSVVPDLSIPATFDVVVGEETMTLDSALDALKELSQIMKKAEEKQRALRTKICASLVNAGLEQYISRSGVQATVYESATTNWSAERLREVLTENEQEYCKVSKSFRTIRIS